MTKYFDNIDIAAMSFLGVTVYCLITGDYIGGTIAGLIGIGLGIFGAVRTIRRAI